MGYYPVIKRNELLIHITIWMKLKNTTLNGRNQSQKATYYMVPFL